MSIAGKNVLMIEDKEECVVVLMVLRASSNLMPFR